jgi:hypothetical protein
MELGVKTQNQGKFANLGFKASLSVVTEARERTKRSLKGGLPRDYFHAAPREVRSGEPISPVGTLGLEKRVKARWSFPFWPRGGP